MNLVQIGEDNLEIIHTVDNWRQCERHIQNSFKKSMVLFPIR